MTACTEIVGCGDSKAGQSSELRGRWHKQALLAIGSLSFAYRSSKVGRVALLADRGGCAGSRRIQLT